MKFVTVFAAFLIFNGLLSCSGGDSKANKGEDSAKPTYKINQVSPKAKPTDTRRPAIININDTIATKMTVLYMKDSAATFERISVKLGQIYGVKLAAALKQNKMKMAGAPMAWYKTQKAPFFFEAGVPVTKKPVKLPAGVFVREMAADSVTLAHFYGPYDLMSQGYDAIKDRLKDMHHTASGAPYEIYIGDPLDKNGKMIDPYKVRTDIVFPRN